MCIMKNIFMMQQYALCCKCNRAAVPSATPYTNAEIKKNRQYHSCRSLFCEQLYANPIRSGSINLMIQTVDPTSVDQ